MPKRWRACRGNGTVNENEEELVCLGGRTHKRRGSLVYCGTCDKILGYINETGYISLYIMLVCKCGTEISIKYNYDTDCYGRADTLETLYSGSGTFVCSACGNPLISFKTSAIEYFACSVSCVCGKEYAALRQIKCSKRLEEIQYIEKK